MSSDFILSSGFDLWQIIDDWFPRGAGSVEGRCTYLPPHLKGGTAVPCPLPIANRGLRPGFDAGPRQVDSRGLSNLRHSIAKSRHGRLLRRLRCPLWVESPPKPLMSALGRKQTLGREPAT